MDKLFGSRLISLIFFYGLIILLIIYFANQVLTNQSIDQNIYIVILVVAVSVPAVLLASMTVYIMRLYRDRKTDLPGSVLKSRLILYFLVLIIISAGPQAVLSLSFIRIIGDTWFNEDIGRGLENSLTITADIQNNLITELRDFVFSPLFLNISEKALINPERVYTQLRQVRPTISAIQIFSEDGEVLYLQGGIGINYEDIEEDGEGSVVRDTRQDQDFIRILRRIDNFTLIVFEELPPNFTEKTIAILEAYDLFQEYQRIKNLLFTGIILLYVFFSVPLISLAILAGFYLSNNLIQPIVNLETAMRRVTEGDFSIRILSSSHDVMKNLNVSFNRMIVELDHSRGQLVQSERIAAWKEIAQRLAHEIKNPLTPIRLSIERLHKKYKNAADDLPEVFDRTVTTILHEVAHLSHLITNFRDFARLPHPKLEKTRLKPILDDVQATHQTAKIKIDIDSIPIDLELFIDDSQFRQVITNLILNAKDAIGDVEGEIRITTQLLKLGGKNFQRVQIQDSGAGISAEHQSEIFNPYFTTKVKGTGLGLPIVQRIIQDHNGEISFESVIGKGTRFFIDLPLMEEL